MLDIIYGEITSPDVAELTNTLRRCDIQGTLYLGYPVLVGADAKIFVDAMLVSPQIGLVAFDVSHEPDDINALSEHQDQIYALLYNKLNAIPELRSGRRLAFEINVITVSPTIAGPIADGNMVVVHPQDVAQELATLEPIRPELIRPLNAAIQRISTLRPQNKRVSVTRENSRGGVLRQIGKEIANLDTWQKRAAIEYANGPQRIRGLAGSGKTVVLALKAAYLTCMPVTQNGRLL